MDKYERFMFLKSLPKEDLLSILAKTEQQNKDIKKDNERLSKENEYFKDELNNYAGKRIKKI